MFFEISIIRFGDFIKLYFNVKLLNLCRMSHDSIANQQIKCTQNFPFEIIAVPQYNDSQLIKNTENNLNEPINIKIRIRNKEEVGKKHGVISVPKLPSNSGRKIRLVSSDQTIMSFDLVMEPETSKKYQKKSHKNIFHIFRPGACLKTQDNDDEYTYSPSSFSGVNNIKSTSSIVDEPNNIISEKITLRKNFPLITPTDRLTKSSGKFMGKCKPGGCLDPPFDEGKYSYEPTTEPSNVSHTKKDEDKRNVLVSAATKDILNIESVIKINDNRIHENIVRTKLDNYQETNSDSLITYPTSLSDNDLKEQTNLQKYNNSDDIKIKKRISSEDKARISFNEFSETYFMPPKKDKIKKLENTPSKNIEKENEILIDNKKSEHSCINYDQLEPPALVTKAHSPILYQKTDTNGGSKTKLDIEKNKKPINKIITDTENVTYPLKIVKSVEITKNVQNSLPQSHSNDTDTNILKSSEISPHNSVIAKKFSFDNNINTSSTIIQLKEIVEPSNILNKSKETFKQKIEEYDNTNIIKRISFKDKNVDMNTIQTAPSETKTKDEETKTKDEETKAGDQSLTVSQESLKMKLDETVDMDNIEVPFIQTVESQDTDQNDNSKYGNIASKKIEDLVKGSEESLSKRFKEIVNVSDVEVILRQNKVKNDIETNINNKNPETITNTNYILHREKESTNSKDQEQSQYKKFLQSDNIFIDDEFQRVSSVDVSNFVDLEKSKSMDVLNMGKEKKISSISLIQDKIHETKHRSLHEEKKVSTVEKFKEIFPSELLQNKFGSEKHFDVDREKIFNELYDSTDLLKNQMTDIKNKTSSEIPKVIQNIDDKQKSIFNVKNYNDEISNKLDLSGLDNLREHSTNSMQYIDKIEDKADINYTVQRTHEVDLNVSSYSSIVIDFGFRCSINKDNKLTIQSFDTSIPAHKDKRDKISVIKSIIRVNSDKIKIPIHYDTDLTMQIEKATVKDKGITSKNQNKSEKDFNEISSDKPVNKDSLLQETLSALYENLIPLNTIIRNLKEEANMLSQQQISLKETLQTLEIQPKRLIHNKLQCGCEKK